MALSKDFVDKKDSLGLYRLPESNVSKFYSIVSMGKNR